MTYSKYFLILFFAILFINSVKAETPFTIIYNFPDGFTLKATQEPYLIQGADFIYHIHVYNSSNGKPISNNSATCYYHLYNQSGSHIYTQIVSEMDTNFDFILTVAGSNFSNRGEYSYTIQCNNSETGGSINHNFYVTGNGEQPFEDLSKLILFVIIFLIYSILIASIIIQITKLALLNVTIYDAMISIIFYVMLVLMYFLSKNYLMTTYAEELMSWSLFAGAFTNVILPLIGFFISFFKKSLDKQQVPSVNEIYGGRL